MIIHKVEVRHVRKRRRGRTACESLNEGRERGMSRQRRAGGRRKKLTVCLKQKRQVNTCLEWGHGSEDTTPPSVLSWARNYFSHLEVGKNIFSQSEKKSTAGSTIIFFRLIEQANGLDNKTLSTKKKKNFCPSVHLYRLEYTLVNTSPNYRLDPDTILNPNPNPKLPLSPI